MSQSSNWQTFNQHFIRYPQLGFSLDTSLMGMDDSFLQSMTEPAAQALKAMQELEAGSIANPDEQRMVGHYWLRTPALAPSPDLSSAINDTLEATLQFAEKIHSAQITAPNGKPFTRILVIGIGGSALGPQLVAEAITPLPPKLALDFFDNTDPDGISRTLKKIGPELSTTLTIVISKSGGTKETRNGMLLAEAAYTAHGLSFPAHAVAVTGEGSKLDQVALTQGWLARFPMWDWVGGRTSVMSAVGTLPAALQGVDVRQFLAGAAAMDQETRSQPTATNAAMRLALAWYHAGQGKGRKDMVVLPYKDRLMLFSKYLQQLVMESLGKEQDLSGNIVHQGIAVYGNKGSTDQHAYIQQLRDGVNNFFATFIEVRKAEDNPNPQEVEPAITSGDFLQGFLRGTRQALAQNQRASLTLSIAELNAFTLGLLIALFERAVGLYASLINVNAYHQPGVEAGKVAAETFLANLKTVHSALPADGSTVTAETLAQQLQLETEEVYHILTHLSANGRCQLIQGSTPATDSFQILS